MSLLFGARDRDEHPSPEGIDRHLGYDGQAGRYFTDGVNLFRSLGTIDRASSPTVGLENCRSLDVVLIPVDELRRRRLRPVIPTRSG